VVQDECMWISRLRISGGFLADTDIAFTRGLNVVIGGRGAGKTTLLELIRHALGLPYADERRAQKTNEMIRTILGNGSVTLDVESELDAFRVTVDADGAGRRGDLSDWALMMSQNEIEAIASSADARLNLLDLRARVTQIDPSDDSADVLTRQMFEWRGQLGSVDEELAQADILQREFDQATQREATLMSAVSTEVASMRAKLADIEARVTSARQDRRQSLETLERLSGVTSAVASLGERLRDLQAGEKPSSLLLTIDRVAAQSESARSGIARGMAEVSVELANLHEDAERREIAARSEAEPVRGYLEETEAGLGEVTAELQALRTKLERVERLRKAKLVLLGRLQVASSARQSAFAAAEVIGERVYQERIRAAEEVSRGLTERVVVTVDHLADTRSFSQIMMSAMQGSSLQYRGIVELIANRMLPSDLLELVEQGRAKDLAESIGIASDRAARFIEHFDRTDALGALARTRLDDRVDFWLVEKGVKKSVDQLSTGQRCAVTLPLLLSEHSRTLILDQPEDHLDNAYLVDNIVDSFASRALASAQTIVATHNPNIPVLGEAGCVISLESDGIEGRVSEIGPFDAPKIVDRITRLMEGGAEAFARRAAFYRQHGQSVG